MESYSNSSANITGWLLRLAVRERPDYSVTGKGKEDNSHSCLCLNSPLFRLRCGTFMQRLLRWKCRNVLGVPRPSASLTLYWVPLKLSNSSFLFSVITNPLFHTSYSMWFRPHQPRRTSRAAPAAPHQPLCTRLRIHRIRAHARPYNAVHSPSRGERERTPF